MPNKNIFFNEAIRKSILTSIKKDKRIILMGLGVDDPKGVFGTTLNIHKKFRNQVFGYQRLKIFTGFALGLAISGFKPIIVHQRVEFFAIN